VTPATPTITVSRAASELRIVLGQLVRRLRAENTFSISQGTVLARLEREGPQTTSALAASERVRPQSMANTIGELLAAGLVARRPDPLDRRRILIEITDVGTETLTRDRQRREGWLAAAIAGLSADEQKTLVRAVPLLRRLAETDVE
jgi:DNA-binding MarR family transcriptional regulator